MKAIGYEQTGPVDGAGALKLFETAKPEPGPHDLVVRV